MVPIATGLNQTTNYQLYRVDLPVWVALAPGEIYYNRQYFRDDGMTDKIESITLEKGRQAWLRVETYAVRGSVLNTFDGNIMVPPRSASRCSENCTQITAISYSGGLIRISLLTQSHNSHRT